MVVKYNRQVDRETFVSRASKEGKVLTVAEAITFLQGLPPEAQGLPLAVSVEADCVSEHVTNVALVQSDRVLWATTGT